MSSCINCPFFFYDFSQKHSHYKQPNSPKATVISQENEIIFLNDLIQSIKRDFLKKKKKKSNSDDVCKL